MLISVNQEEYCNLISDLNKNEETKTKFKPEIPSKRNNHIEFYFMKMIEENGSEDLQGIVSAEVYRTKRGNVISISTLYVCPQYKNNDYEVVLIINLLRKISEKYNIETVITSNLSKKFLDQVVLKSAGCY